MPSSDGTELFTYKHSPAESTPLTACARALKTVELLEHVIFQLPCRRVPLMSRVSILWKDTITGSTKLQTALFMKSPSGESMDSSLPEKASVLSKGTIVRSTKLHTKSSVWRPSSEEEDQNRERSTAIHHGRADWGPPLTLVVDMIKHATSKDEIAIINPLFVATLPKSFICHLDPKLMSLKIMCDLSTFIETLQLAQLRDQLLTQPPMTDISVYTEATSVSLDKSSGYESLLEEMEESGDAVNFLDTDDAFADCFYETDNNEIEFDVHAELADATGITIASLDEVDHAVRKLCGRFSARDWLLSLSFDGTR